MVRYEPSEKFVYVVGLASDEETFIVYVTRKYIPECQWEVTGFGEVWLYLPWDEPIESIDRFLIDHKPEIINAIYEYWYRSGKHVLEWLREYEKKQVDWSGMPYDLQVVRVDVAVPEWTKDDDGNFLLQIPWAMTEACRLPVAVWRLIVGSLMKL